MKSSFSTFPPLNPVRAQRGYPPLSQFPALFDKKKHIGWPSMVTGTLTNKDEHVIEFGSSNGQNQLESPIITTPDPNEHTTGFQGEAEGEGGEVEAKTGEEKEPEGEAETEGEAEAEAEAEVEVQGEGETEAEAEGEAEAEAEGEGDSSDDPRNPRINGQRLTNPKVAPYALTMVLTLLGLVIIILKQGKHTFRIAKAYMLLFVVSFGIAYATYSIYSWITDSSNYQTLKGIYYICCTVGFISLLLMMYTSTA